MSSHDRQRHLASDGLGDRQVTLPTTTAIVLNHDGEDLLPWGLPSIVEEAQRYPGGCQVWVIDNASTDRSRALLHDRFPDVTVIPHDNDVLASYNDVATQVRTETLVLLNNDVRVAPGSFQALARALGPEDFCVGARLFGVDGGLQTARTRARLLHGLIRFERDLEQGAGGLTAFAPAAFCMVRVDRFLALEGFDPVFHPGYFEDADLCLRAWSQGWPCRISADAGATHQDRASFSRRYDARTLAEIWLRNEILLTDKHVGRSPIVTFWSGIRRTRALVSRRRAVVAAAVRGAEERRPTIRRDLGRDPHLLERFAALR